MSTLMQVNDTNFDAEVLKSALPVMVDFLRHVVRPVQAAHPVIEALAKDYAGKLKVVKLEHRRGSGRRVVARDHGGPDGHDLQGRHAKSMLTGFRPGRPSRRR